MASITFTKGQGTGNDFVLYADPEGELDLSPEQVAAVCDRHFGVGADGLLRAVRSSAIDAGAAALAEHPGAEWFMDYRNGDGSIAEMCGNGVRVFARFLTETGLLDLPEGGQAAIGTRAGVKLVERSGDGFRVDMGPWRLDGNDALVRAKELDVPRPGLGIDVGNPHIVVALPSEDDLERADLAYAPVLDPVQPAGANVELVVPRDPMVIDGVGYVRMRVHERGSGETLSCGTGAVAAALAVRHWAGAGAPDDWRVAVPGGVVGVRMFPGAGGEHTSLEGPAELVYTGTLEV